MIKIGLTGNRYSGKDRVARLFQQISIPVFQADIVLKFILNHNFEIQHNLKKNIGNGIFKSETEFDTQVIKLMTNGFDRVFDEAEFELLKAYEKFRLKNRQSIYTVFHSSILFERELDKNMDYTISVFSPITERIERCQYLDPSKSLSGIHDLMGGEMKDLDKNKKSTYIIHNYSDHILGGMGDQVTKIDQKIIDKYLQNEHSWKV